MGTFGFIGYWAHQWDERAGVLLAERRAQLTERRQRQMAKDLTAAAVSETGAEDVTTAGVVAEAS
jgi:hypothetical protein